MEPKPIDSFFSLSTYYEPEEGKKVHIKEIPIEITFDYLSVHITDPGKKIHVDSDENRDLINDAAKIMKIIQILYSGDNKQKFFERYVKPIFLYDCFLERADWYSTSILTYEWALRTFRKQPIQANDILDQQDYHLSSNKLELAFQMDYYETLPYMWNKDRFLPVDTKLITSRQTLRYFLKCINPVISSLNNLLFHYIQNSEDELIYELLFFQIYSSLITHKDNKGNFPMYYAVVKDYVYFIDLVLTRWKVQEMAKEMLKVAILNSKRKSIKALLKGGETLFNGKVLIRTRATLLKKEGEDKNALHMVVENPQIFDDKILKTMYKAQPSEFYQAMSEKTYILGSTPKEMATKLNKFPMVDFFNEVIEIEKKKAMEEKERLKKEKEKTPGLLQRAKEYFRSEMKSHDEEYEVKQVKSIQ